MTRRTTTGVIAVAIAIVIAAAGGYWWMQRPDAYAFKGGNWEPPKPAPALALLDQQRQPFDLTSMNGKVTLVFFGYTHCPDFCPTTMLEVQQVKHLLGDDADSVETVFVSVDPARDTPERLGDFLGFFDPTFIGLSGTPEETNTIKQQWGIVGNAEAADSNGNYLVNHTTSLFAVDPEGNLRLSWAYGTPPEDIAADIEHLL